MNYFFLTTLLPWFLIIIIIIDGPFMTPPQLIYHLYLWTVIAIKYWIIFNIYFFSILSLILYLK